MRRNVTLDPVTGRFVPTPRGQKTEKMRREETRLGVKFEDDYLEKVVNGDWGQKRFSNRWRVGNRSSIFGKLHGGRRSWVEMLSLPSNREQGAIREERSNTKGCAICGAANVSLEKAHWIPAHDGGPATWWNRVALCPTCHTRLDNDDRQAVRDVEEVVLLKAVRRLLEQKDEMVLRKQLVDICAAIVTRQVPDLWRALSEQANSAES
jgi:5-methylcytosine-specific restriction endonuclease McrA